MTPKILDRNDVEYLSTKTYTHSQGLSASFRQWQANSHCRFIHGYALQVKLTFGCTELDKNNWVQDFGGLKPIKAWLEQTFDHKMLVAEDDPMRDQLALLDRVGLAQVVIVPAVGCEAFASIVYNHVEQWLSGQFNDMDYPRVFIEEVEVREHEGNSAIVRRKRVD